MQIMQDIELANSNAHMLVEAVSFADPELEAVEENALICVGGDSRWANRHNS